MTGCIQDTVSIGYCVYVFDLKSEAKIMAQPGVCVRVNFQGFLVGGPRGREHQLVCQEGSAWTRGQRPGREDRNTLGVRVSRFNDNDTAICLMVTTVHMNPN